MSSTSDLDITVDRPPGIVVVVVSSSSRRKTITTSMSSWSARPICHFLL
jgi:hypothetical protein